MQRLLYYVVVLGSVLVAAPSLAGVKPFQPAQPVIPSAPQCVTSPTTLCVPLDASFTTVTFDGPGGNGQANPADPCQRNDDDITNAIALPFTFDLFGTPWTSVFINNNGNVSFGNGFPEFTPSGFPVNGFPMVAPLWSDVDTRSAGSGVVHYRIDSHKLVVIWDHVGYYNEHSDLLNTFELMISDGTDPDVGVGNNVCFCYDDMQWTTGDASSGFGGFGGVPATAGVNRGNGVDFIQFGRFDHPGADSDGPGGANDGIDFLDNRRLCFNVSGTNVPPVPQGFPAGGVIDFCNQNARSVHLATGFTSPELGQTTTTVVTTDLPAARYTLTNTPGNPSSQVLDFLPIAADIGQTYHVTYAATDDGTPVASTTVVLTIHILPGNCPTPTAKTTWSKLKAHYR